MLVNNTNILP